MATSSQKNHVHTIRVVDSHTAGEPTRVVIAGGPDLGNSSIAARCQLLQQQFDDFRTTVIHEPRGSDILVGALLCPPVEPTSEAATIFFNNAGYLGMCGHGLIGVVTTLKYLGRIDVGPHRIETPVGIVSARLHAEGSVSFDNVPSYRHAADVEIQVPELGLVIGDIAWGGNWFFLVTQPMMSLGRARVAELTTLALQIREAVQHRFPQVDHVELFDAPQDASAHARNFVLCPGGQYDRSPCGTGTSAKLACLAASGKLQPGEMWIQEGVLGTSFTGQYRWHDRQRGEVIPTISGRAFITADAHLLRHVDDPFGRGVR